MLLTCHLNGAAAEIDVDDPGMPLVFVLRDLLGLTGTKYSCLQGLCGACTVHLDGVAVRACQVPAAEAAGRAVTTIEGLSPDGTHPVQRAFVDLRVPQCGWCQPGQIMTAAAFLAGTQRPDGAQIAAAMANNLCRCGTGARILSAVMRAAASGAGP